MFNKKEIDNIIYQHFSIQSSLPTDQLLVTESYKLLAVESLIGLENNKIAIDNFYHCIKVDVYLRILEILVNDNAKYVFHISWDDKEFKVFTISRWHWSKAGYQEQDLDPKLYWDLDHDFAQNNKYDSIFTFESKIKEIIAL